MSNHDDPISPIEDITIEDARRGPRLYILADAEDRENEGDVIDPGPDGHAGTDQLHGPSTRAA